MKNIVRNILILTGLNWIKHSLWVDVSRLSAVKEDRLLTIAIPLTWTNCYLALLDVSPSNSKSDLRRSKTDVPIKKNIPMFRLVFVAFIYFQRACTNNNCGAFAAKAVKIYELTFCVSTLKNYLNHYKRFLLDSFRLLYVIDRVLDRFWHSPRAFFSFYLFLVVW